MTTTARARRISGTAVPMHAPVDGPIFVVVFGEAPGPRGADQSGVPFFGDGAGKHLYRALVNASAAVLPPLVASLKWDGALFRANGLVPSMHGVALGNAYDRCPTDDGVKFRAPTRGELEGVENFARLTRDIDVARVRGLRGIVTLGKVAERTIDALAKHTDLSALTRVAVPHPSAQGLLSMAPNRGKGARLADLEDAWVVRCRAAFHEAGLPEPMP